ncbi:putative ATP-dependent RNA helicase DDX55 [Paratrimastix pyriformis]|uniref:ATP-dependent RNA helicase n=1 Tax=Paratrimastix pyriformis TaxID=342808 RepID=A0ABQ8UEX4_9EUKA|nr:putative ATP-dependent RNA helicase DDX55 [Paratrimastix pyriformis]
MSKPSRIPDPWSFGGQVVHLRYPKGFFRAATPVQARVIPLFLSNKDVNVEACTGSGKTLSYVIPAVEILLKQPEPLKPGQIGVVVIVPTRELAGQVASIFQQFTSIAPRPLGVLTLVGGTSHKPHIVSFSLLSPSVPLAPDQRTDIVVASPGRLEQHLSKGELDARTLEVLILDEADRLLDIGFSATLNTILGRLPKQRRTGIFSATQTTQVADLARAGLRNGVIIRIPRQQALAGSKHTIPETEGPNKKPHMDQESELPVSEAPGEDQPASVIPEGLCNYYLCCEAAQKPAVLLEFLDAHPQSKVIIYVLTCHMVEYFAKVLPSIRPALQPRLVALHGRMSQNKRSATLDHFLRASDRSPLVLITTDVAARGLDFPDVDWILQYDPPQDPNVFVHRIGRTARMGKQGAACVFLLPQETLYVEFLGVRHVPLQPLPQEVLPPSARPTVDASPRDAPPSDSPTLLTPAPAPATDIGQSLRRLALEDRAIMEKAQQAFVSFVRAYGEHHCSYVFQMKRLPWVSLFDAFGLLKVPSMPELRRLHFPQWAPLPRGFDLDQVAYRDKGREEARQEALKNGVFKARADAKKAELLQKRKEARQKAKSLHSKRFVFDLEEEAEISNEARLLRKLRKGKITEEEFAQAVGEEAPMPTNPKKSGQEVDKKSDQTETETEASGDDEDEEKRRKEVAEDEEDEDSSSLDDDDEAVTEARSTQPDSGQAEPSDVCSGTDPSDESDGSYQSGSESSSEDEEARKRAYAQTTTIIPPALAKIVAERKAREAACSPVATATSPTQELTQAKSASPRPWPWQRTCEREGKATGRCHGAPVSGLKEMQAALLAELARRKSQV